MTRVALLLAVLLLSPLAAAQLPQLPVALPPPPGPLPDEGGQQYALAFDCGAAENACPARLAVTGESLGAPALAADPANPARIVLASLGGPNHDGITLQTSTDGGATFSRSAVLASGARAVALAPAGEGRVLMAVAKTDGVSVWRFPFDKPPGAPEATLPAAQPDKLSAIATNQTSALAWREGLSTRVAWDASNGSAPDWRVTSEACGATSNLVSLRGAPLVACASPEGAAVYALNLTGQNLTLVSVAPVAGEPWLVMTERDRVVLAAMAFESPTSIHLRVTSGVNASGWTLPMDSGARIHRVNATPAQSAKLLAMSYQPTSGTIHLLWEERPVQQNATDRRVVKFLVALSARGTFYYKHDLDVDEPPARAQGNALLAPVDDAKDALFVLGTRELIAFGDDGGLVFGELLERSTLPRQSVAIVSGKVSQQATALSEPPPKFTLGFSIAAGLLALGVVARVIYGRKVRP